MKIEKNKIALISTGTILVLALAGGAFYEAKKFENSNTGKQENTNNNSNSSSNGNNSNNSDHNSGNQSDAPSVTIDWPKEGASLSGKHEISGTSKNSGGTLRYEVNGQEGGLLAEGTISTGDDSKQAKTFSVNISFTKKPTDGDVGTVKIFDANNKEIKSVGVSF